MGDAQQNQVHSVLALSDRITMLPIVHGSADCARMVRRWMIEHAVDCVAVPLPPSFAEPVQQGVQRLPIPSIVVQENGYQRWNSQSNPEFDFDELMAPPPAWTYVPIDPCQSVIAAIRAAAEERLPIEFIDRECEDFHPIATVLPDPYALKTVALERFAAAILPNIKRPDDPLSIARFRHLGQRLRELERKCSHIVFICSIAEWPWIREAYFEPADIEEESELVSTPKLHRIDPDSLLFLFGELPYITGVYEKARAELDSEENLSIDAIKLLLLTARSDYFEEFGKRARRVSPLHLRQCLKYIRNLTLLESRMTPDLYTIGLACQQIMGDQFAIHLVEAAREYPYTEPYNEEEVQLGIDRLRLSEGEVVPVVSRLPGTPMVWRSLDLHRKPPRHEKKNWKMQWNPIQQCSWPPEDTLIESFRTRVIERAATIMGTDLARSEKFTSSVKDGIDIRETIRHWYDADIYVKVLPPNRGTLDACLMIFDSPADPRDYPWRATWFAEHEDESTLAFYATHFRDEMLGPGIGVATYGGALFLYPPRPIENIWSDSRLDFTNTLEERLLAAACLHSESRQVALLSKLPPGAGWRKLARHFKKTLVHVPIGQFNDAKIQQLRMFHVLNGRQVRSYAAEFIRRA